MQIWIPFALIRLGQHATSSCFVSERSGTPPNHQCTNVCASSSLLLSIALMAIYMCRHRTPLGDICSFVDSEPRKLGGTLNFVSKNQTLCPVSALCVMTAGISRLLADYMYYSTPRQYLKCPDGDIYLIFLDTQVYCVCGGGFVVLMLATCCLQVSQYPLWREQLSFMLAVNKPTDTRLLDLHQQLLAQRDMVSLTDCTISKLMRI